MQSFYKPEPTFNLLCAMYSHFRFILLAFYGPSLVEGVGIVYNFVTCTFITFILTLPFIFAGWNQLIGPICLLHR